MGVMIHFLRTESVLQQIEEALVQNHGDMQTACRALGLSVASVHHWRADDPEVEKRVRVAQQIGWSTLESEAYRRAVIGNEEDVYFQGNIVGQKRVYSDGLLSQLLKARVEAYKPEAQNVAPVSVNVNIMPRADSYAEWLDMRKQALDGGVIQNETAQQALPPPDSANGPEEAQYTNIQQSTLKDIL